MREFSGGSDCCSVEFVKSVEYYSDGENYVGIGAVP